MFNLLHPIKHFLTITRHRHIVMRLCFKAGIGLQGLKHDLSKYSWCEFRIGMKYYQGDHSPNAREKEIYGYSSAWLHHKGRNKHHFEYWVDHDPEKMTYVPIKMPIRYVKEMFCDRIAATKVYMKKNYNPKGILDYHNRHKDKYVMHTETEALLVSWINLLIDKGEKAAFKIIRTVKEY